jgi:hypothetical protein
MLVEQCERGDMGPLRLAALANRGCERIPPSQASLQVDTPTRRLASKLLGLLSRPREPSSARQPYQPVAAELIHHARPPLPHLAALPAPAPTTFVRPPRLPAQVARAASPIPRPARRCILEVIILFSRQSAIVAQHGSEQRQARGVHRPRCVCEGRALSVMSPDARSAYGASDATPEHFSEARMANNAF